MTHVWRLPDGREFRPGTLVRALSGKDVGKYSRIVGINESFPDFIGDPTYIYAWCDEEWVPEATSKERFSGLMFLSDLEPMEKVPEEHRIDRDTRSRPARLT
jgi:hypothetical protein